MRHTGTVAQPRVVDWQRQHPLLQFVDLGRCARRRGPAPDAARRRPAASWTRRTRRCSASLRSRTCAWWLLGFDLMQSDLPLRVAFPVFIGNLLRLAGTPRNPTAAARSRPAPPYRFISTTPMVRISVQDPQGRRQDYDVQGNPWIFSDAPQRVGVYTLRAGDTFKRYLTVNLLDDGESDINPANKLPPLAARRSRRFSPRRQRRNTVVARRDAGRGGGADRRVVHLVPGFLTCACSNEIRSSKQWRALSCSRPIRDH